MKKVKTAEKNVPVEKVDKGEKPDKAHNAAKAEKAETPEMPGMPVKPGTSEKAGNAQGRSAEPENTAQQAAAVKQNKTGAWETTEHRIWNMSRIRSKNTALEIRVRKYLFHKGFRYRICVKDLPGKPDIVLRKYRTVIFVNGCFWHRHPYCKLCTTPKTNTDRWQKKFDRNVSNDRKNCAELEAAGWNVTVLWECEIENSFDLTMQRLINDLEQNYIKIIEMKAQVL